MTTTPVPTLNDPASTVRGAFLQVIEFRTDQPERVTAAVDEFTATIGGESLVVCCATAADRDRPGIHLLLVEFADYESAMRNSAHPAAMAFARALQRVATDVAYRNWDMAYA